MSSENKLSIIDRRLKLAGERIRKMNEFMEPYDREVYNPALALLREECAGEGHDPVSGKTGMWSICGNCGDSYIGKIR